MWECLLLLALLRNLQGSAAGSDQIPVLSEEPECVVQKLGGSVSLRCAAQPSNATISWRLNGQDLGQEPHLLAELGVLVGHGVLTIPVLNNLTLGRYQCVAHTAAGAIASVLANVTAANLSDFKAENQQEIEVEEGNTAVIECHLPESQPKAQVRYSVNQEWLETSKGNYLIMPSGNLQIVNVTLEDEGSYKCAAYNPITQEVKTSSSADQLRIRRSPSEGARIIYPPSSRSIRVTKGQRLVLECVASGTPPPRVTWNKDGLEVSEHNTTRFLLSNLLIDTASEDDSGTYACRADSGELSSASVLYHVQVFEPPQVSVQLQQQAVPWGGSVRFVCLASGKPTPSVLWLHNARPLSPSPRHRVSARMLRVTQVGPQDEGVYQCLAENAVGSAQAAAQLLTIPTGPTHRAGRPAVPDMLRPLSPHKVLQERPVSHPTTDCPGLASTAEAPVILSQPRTGKADLYELTWKPRHDGGAPVREYLIKYRKAGDPLEDWIIRNVSGAHQKLTLLRLESNSLYEVEMSAKNCAGVGQPAMMTFRTGKGRKNSGGQNELPKAAPIEPSRLSPPEAPGRPTISTASETSAYVTWIPRGNRGFPIQSFRVEYKKLQKVGSDWMLAVSDIPPSLLSVEIPELEKGMAYKFRVRAVNVLGESPPSAPSRAYTVLGGSHRNPERPVNGPYITYNEAINETTIILKWTYTPSNNNTPIYGFYIFYRPTDSDNDSDYKRDIVEGDRYWHSITDLQPETAYDIKMQCYNEGGESEFGNVVILETKARRHPRPLPTDLPAHRPPHSGGPVPRPSDLPYLIVGVVLGAVVFIIVAFIPFCLWRSWAKQKQTSQLCYPVAAPPISSCQYTMVPLQGLPVVPQCPLDSNHLPPAAKHPYCLPGLHREDSHLDALVPPSTPSSVYQYMHSVEESCLPNDSVQKLIDASGQALAAELGGNVLEIGDVMSPDTGLSLWTPGEILQERNVRKVDAEDP